MSWMLKIQRRLSKQNYERSFWFTGTSAATVSTWEAGPARLKTSTRFSRIFKTRLNGRMPSDGTSRAALFHGNVLIQTTANAHPEAHLEWLTRKVIQPATSSLAELSNHRHGTVGSPSRNRR